MAKSKEGKFVRFLKDEKALRGFLQICVILFALAICIILFILLLKSDSYAQQIVPLLTFILGTLLGGIGTYLWGNKKNES
jgi:predicted RND superfamily exporter protein